MPIYRLTRRGRLIGWRWGRQGKIYRTRAGAVRQAQAAHARIAVSPYRRRTGPVRPHTRSHP